MSTSVDVLAAAGAQLAEGPIWMPERSAVAWTDIPAHTIELCTLHGERSVMARLAHPAGAIALTNGGALIAATPRGLELVGPDASVLAPLPEVEPGLRMNDGKPDPVGRFVGGTMSSPRAITGSGALWSFGPSSARPLLRDVTISNGLCWSADGGTMFYIDTPTQRVDAFDYDLSTGDISGRRTVVEIPSDDGAPDGMTIDDEGGLWIALWGGSCVRRYEGGTITAEISLPTPFVTCPVFAGDALDVLVVTTASEPFGARRPAGAGDIYVVRPGVRGRPANRFRTTDEPAP